MLQAREICKSYYDRRLKQAVPVLENCSLEIGCGEIVGLMGASGCGKSTLARILLRLLACDSGAIIFQEQDITRTNKLTEFRQKVQFISQRPESFFDPLMKLGQSLVEPLQIFGKKYTPQDVEGVLELVKLNVGLLARYPHQVSGGEIQRLSLARALLLEPEILILDEPTSMLDISVQAQVLHLLKAVQRERGLGYLFIAHDKAVINWFSDRVLYMRSGKII